MVTPRRRSPRAVAVASLVALLCASGAAAQETNTIGPPQLKDFQLPGQRTTPPADPAPTPSTAAPKPAGTRPGAKPAPVAARSSAAAPAAARPATAAPAQPRPRPPIASVPATAATPVPTQAPTRTQATTQAAPAARTAPTAMPAPLPAAATPPAQAAPPAATLRGEPAGSAPAPVAEGPAASGFSWSWLALPLLLLAGAAAFLFLRRGRRGKMDEDRTALAGALFDPEPGPQPASATVPEPAAAAPVAPEPAPEPQPADAPRAWLELDIVPERAAATDNETIVNYELVLRNAGGATAGNIRIDARMFNAGADGEIAEFFSGPIHAHSGSPHVTIPPGEELRLGSAIAMPKAQVRTIEVQGRSIFVPVIATTVAYDWKGGTGRSSKSWLVGREAETPAARMGPFRLDLGPRIYRQVGRREGKLEMV